MGIALQALGRFDEAIQCYELTELSDSRVRTLECLYRLNRYEDFYQRLDELITTDNTNLRVDGPNARGGTVEVKVEGKAGAQAFVGIAAGTSAPVCVGAWTGCLKLDLNLLVVALPFTVPATLPITIPNDPNLIGLGVHFQGLYDVGAPKAAWSNVECIYVYQ